MSEPTTPPDQPPVAVPSHPVAVPSNGYALPLLPLTRADMPADAKPHLGRMVAYAAKTGRPCVGVLVKCRKCKRLHRYPWRWSWGTGLDVVSYQEARCPGRNARKPAWIALDPEAEAESLAAHEASHLEFDVWEAERAAKKAARALLEEGKPVPVVEEAKPAEETKA